MAICRRLPSCASIATVQVPLPLVPHAMHVSVSVALFRHAPKFISSKQHTKMFVQKQCATRQHGEKMQEAKQRSPGEAYRTVEREGERQRERGEDGVEDG